MPDTAPSSRKRDREDVGSPKRSESRTAIGRAPIAKMSRRIPPTPVAAPWNGSTALGWLCDSTLKAQTTPPPTSTAPAFSPGPITTESPSVGSVRSSRFECLYAQCSHHISENIASSTWFGGRRIFSQTRSCSARVRLSATASGAVGSAAALEGGPGARQCEGLEQREAVDGARELVHGVLRVGHQPQDVAPGAA